MIARAGQVYEHNGKSAPSMTMPSPETKVIYCTNYNLDHWHAPMHWRAIRWEHQNLSQGNVMLYRVVL